MLRVSYSRYARPAALFRSAMHAYSIPSLAKTIPFQSGWPGVAAANGQRRYCATSGRDVKDASLKKPINYPPKVLFPVGSTLHGFRCVGIRHVPELDLTGYRLEHVRTGAIYYHFDAPSDRNNAFCIGFRTPAENSRGTTHVLEHTVLCGSEKYQVRDPFFMMLRRSLSNFMNAMTGADYTLYPFSTTNEKDYQNLLAVYLDATLHPLLRAEDFYQEGHRMEVYKKGCADEPPASTEAEGLGTAAGSPTPLTEPGSVSADDAIKYNGVVYNEMKGVMSEPDRHFLHSLYSIALPKTHYEYISGGYPPDILDLTHEQLRDFHARHYHPSNSIVMGYGNQNPAISGTMAMIDEYFSKYDRAEPVPVPCITEFAKSPSVHTTTGPVDLFGDVNAQRRIAVAAAMPDALDTPEALVQLSVLSELLSSGPASPLYKALLAPRLGTKYAPGSGYNYHLSTPLLSFGLQGVSNSREGADEEIDGIIHKVLAKAAEEGFDQRRVDAIVFQEMLQQRHREANYGVGLLISLSALSLVKPHHEVMAFLDSVPILKALAKDPKAILTPLLHQAFLDNPHKVRLFVSPDKDHLNKMNAQIKQREEQLSGTMPLAEKQALAKKSAEWLERVRTPADPALIDTLPTLQVADIPPQPFEEPAPVLVGPLIYHLPYSTNGLVYINVLIPHAASLLRALRQYRPADPSLFTTLGRDGLELVEKSDAAGYQNIADGASTKKTLFSSGAAHYALRQPLLHALLGRTGAGPYNYEELAIALDGCLSGLSVSEVASQHYCSSDPERHNKQNKSPRATPVSGAFTAGATFSFYTTAEKLPQALTLLKLILQEPVLTGTCHSPESTILNRIEVLASARAASVVQSISPSGHRFAMLRAAAMAATSYNGDMLSADDFKPLADALAVFPMLECTSGLTQVQFLTDTWLAKQDGAEGSDAKQRRLLETQQDLIQLAESIKYRSRDMLVWYTCDGALAAGVADQLNTFKQSFEAIDGDRALYAPAPAANEEDLTPFNLDYNATTRDEVARYNGTASPLGSPHSTLDIPLDIDASYAAAVQPRLLPAAAADTQPVRLASILLNNEHLHTAIREQGGAYGAGSASNILGHAAGISYFSYRDPTPARSQAIYAGCGSWLLSGDRQAEADIKADHAQANTKLNEATLGQAKLKLFSQLDAPESPDSFGYRHFFNRVDKTLRQENRNALLGCRPEDVRGVAHYFNQDGEDRCFRVNIVPRAGTGADRQ